MSYIKARDISINTTKPLVAVFGGQGRRPTSTNDLIEARARLIAGVLAQWRTEAEARSLDDQDPMAVCWELRDTDRMDEVSSRGGDKSRFSWRSDDIPAIVEWFRNRPQQRLVLTGPAGSGKTTLAIQILLYHLQDLAIDSPVPVLFSLASWDPIRTPRLDDWIASRLDRDYPVLRAFGNDAASMLCRARLILPVLDGLDEVPHQRRLLIISAINQTLPSRSGLILTSRTAELDQLDKERRIWGAATICALPLVRDDAISYLSRRLPKHAEAMWAAVLTSLRSGEPCSTALTEVVTTPLGLWLIIRIYIFDKYGTPNPTDLISEYTDASSLSQHLLGQLIPAAVHSRRPADRKYATRAERSARPRHMYEVEDVKRWLTVIAVDLRSNNTRDWLWWQLGSYTIGAHLPATWLKWGIGALLSAFYYWFLTAALDVGLILALAITVSWLLLYSIFGGPETTPKHLNTDLRRYRGRGPRRFLGPTLISSTAAMMFTLAVFGFLSYSRTSLDLWLPDYLLDVNFPLFSVGIIFIAVCIGGIYDSMRDLDPTDTSARAPLTSYTQSKLVIAFVSGSFTILWVGLLLSATRIDLATVLLICIFMLSIQPPLHPGLFYYFLSIALRFPRPDRRLPLGLMIFMDDAYRLGLLRQVGAAYQFRHAELQDYLAPR